MGVFELKVSGKPHERSRSSMNKGLGSSILLHNARWFTRIRWGVVCVFAATGLVGSFLPDLAEIIGVLPPKIWPWWFVAMLTLANILFTIHVRGLRFHKKVSRQDIRAGLWFQIVFDLLALTVLVHIVGTTNTFVAFTYLFHIVLACIFFDARNSFLVTLLAACFYLATVLSEVFGFLSPRTILLAGHHEQNVEQIFLAFSAIFVWFVVWYLVSTLSNTVRKREHQLAAANKQLVLADQEKNKQVLRTTHDLKAPFSGIESNIDILRLKYWDEIPDEVRKIIVRIENRSETLRGRIKDILLLGNLKSGSGDHKQDEDVDLVDLVRFVINDLAERASHRHVSVKTALSPASIKINPKQLAALLSNILSNAITYSHKGGSVKVTLEDRGDEIHILVKDHGIGIKDKNITHIFEEYYRSKEAAEFNAMSTGLGLAIVKQAAQNLGVKIIVKTKHEKGTTFDIVIPQGRISEHGED